MNIRVSTIYEPFVNHSLSIYEPITIHPQPFTNHLPFTKHFPPPSFSPGAQNEPSARLAGHQGHLLLQRFQLLRGLGKALKARVHGAAGREWNHPWSSGGPSSPWWTHDELARPWVSRSLPAGDHG